MGQVASVSKAEFRPKVKSMRKFAKVLILLGKAAENMFLAALIAPHSSVAGWVGRVSN